MPKEDLLEAVINDRYVIGEEIGGGYSGFVRTGEFANALTQTLIFLDLFIKCQHFNHKISCEPGVDLITSDEVAIKFAWGNETTKPPYEEYEMYLHLNADGNYLILTIHTNLIQMAQ